MPGLSKIARKRLIQDAAIVALSVFVATFIVKTGTIHFVISHFREAEFFMSFFAGALFTSVFTTAPSIAILGEIAQENSLWVVALVGGLGAMCGDYILFRLVRDRVSEDLRHLWRLPRVKRAARIFNTVLPRVLWPLLGAFVIASPLPDELGIMILGLSKVDQKLFLPLSFVMNSIGILLIGLSARAIG